MMILDTNFNLFLVIFTLLLILGSCEQQQEEQETNPPNIILILTDDQGWGDLSVNGNTSLSTPNIDKLVTQGVTFDRFFVSPVCSPTRAEILTGRYAVRAGVYSTSAGGERMDLDETTVAQVFKNAGYQTAAYGKWHNGMQAGYHPNARGFDDYYGFCSGHWGNYFDPMLEHNGAIVKGEGFLTDDLTNRGIDFISDNVDKPFFLYLPYNTPHSPMQVPDRFYKKFADIELSQKGSIPDKEETLHTRAALAMCENIDWNVGRLINTLLEKELLENTIVLYLADNGPNGHRWNGDMKGVKGSTDEGGVRSPLTISWKGVLPAGKHITKIASSLDLLPTLADLAGIDAPLDKTLDGMSLKPILLGDDANWPDRLVYNYWRDKLSVRSQQYRLGHKGKLFNMITDPNQLEDISERERDVKQELETAKAAWLKTVRAELPEQDTRTFDIGHPDQIYTQIPARDATAHGNIVRSNRFPNNTYMTNWIGQDDKITWDTEVLSAGTYEVELYYSCPAADVGSKFNFSIGGVVLNNIITEAHDPPVTGEEHDRFPRQESYVKEWKPMILGQVQLQPGKASIELKATNIKNKTVMDFRLLMLKKIS